MSLEQAIADLAIALRENTQALALTGRAGTGQPTLTTAANQAVPAAAAASKPRGRPPGQTATAGGAAAPSAPSTAAATTGQPVTQVNGVGYPDVKAAIMLLAQQKGHAAALNVLAQFGVTHGNQLRPDQWPAAKTALDQAVAGLA